MNDETFMRQAVTAGRRRQGSTAENPSVGCVIVSNGEIVAVASTAPGGRPHAETQALAMAGEAARGATAFVTLEPCCHHGHTPPCTDALVDAGIARVVTALDDPDPERALTKRGIRRTKAAARGLAALGVKPQYVFTSPYRRAIESGEIASKVLTKSKTNVLAIDELLPDRHPREFLRVIRDIDEGDVVCTGHVPHLDILTANCLGSVAMFTSLGKSGAACIEFLPERPRGNLLWLMDAKSLRMLGKA